MSASDIALAQINAPGWVRKLLYPSVGGLVTGLVIVFFKLFDKQPVLAIDLLKAWGPNFLLGLVVLAVIAGLMSRLMDISLAGVQAQGKMAEAMTRIAEKDDRQIQEIQTLTTFTAQESRRTNDHLREFRECMERNSGCLERLTEKLSKCELIKGGASGDGN